VKKIFSQSRALSYYNWRKNVNSILLKIIIKKREAKELTKDEIRFFIESYLKNEIPEYQMSAFFDGNLFQ